MDVSWIRLTMTSCSQILETLMDVNDSQKLPPHTRYDLSSPTSSATNPPDLEPDDSEPLEAVHDAQLALREAKQELESGAVDRSSYQSTEAELLRVIREGRKLKNLYCTVHTRPETKLGDVSMRELMSELWEEDVVGYLTPTHAEEYLAQFDARLENVGLEEPTLPAAGKGRGGGDREKDREGMGQNLAPASSWVTSVRTKDGVDEEEVVKASGDTPAPRTSRRSLSKGGAAARPSKRGAAALKDEELLDEEGRVLGVTEEGAVGGAAKKRRRGAGGAEDDGSYRPKGGGSRKRKRASTKGAAAVEGAV